KHKKNLKNMMKKYKKYINYLISGVITVIISVVTFKIFLLLNIKYVIAFTLSQIIAITFAFLATRKRVYNSKATKKSEIAQESIKFFIGRAFTYVVNLVLLMIAVDIFKLDEFYSNLVITIIVIILNYFIGDIMINKLTLKK
ncbi:MAG: GtrA family protein, partial [Clostridia bacterium]|nr:GtrA family protein [Clostridia bacterium]